MRAALSFLMAGSLFAATTQTWEMNNYQDFLKGRINGLALTRDGRMKLGPKLDELFASDQSEIWSLARTPDGTLYAGTGNRGRLYKIDPAGKSSLVWTADQPREDFLLTALSGCVDSSARMSVRPNRSI